MVWGRAAEPVADTIALPGAPDAMSTTASSIEEAPVGAAIRTTAPIQDAALIEHTTRAETTPQASRRTRSTARTGVSSSEAAADSPASGASSRSATRRARTTALEVAAVAPAVDAPARTVVRAVPVMELRQVDTTTGPALPTLAAALTGSITAVPVVDAPRRNRTRPVAGEPVATPAPIVAEAVATAEPVADPHPPTATAEPAVAAHEASVTVAPEVDEHEPSITAEPAVVAEPAAAEPVLDETVEEPGTDPRVDEAHVDEFEAAARLFSFTGETPVQRPAESPAAESVAAESEEKPAHKAPRRKKKHTGGARRAATASFSIGVMGIVGLLAVGMTTPAEAVAASAGTANTSAFGPAGDVAINVSGTDSQDIQAYMAPTQAQPTALDRSIDYSAVTAAQAGADSGIKNVSNAYFTNDPNSPIQWPFAVGCTISWGFGPRPGEFHEGVDFTPGAGAHVQAIADGVVRVSTDNGGGYGVMIIIDHIIDGKLVSSRYGHMQYGSRQVQVGDHVHVGEYIGRTGNTGRSYGAHTHLEILLNGTTPIDPIPWLRAHVK